MILNNIEVEILASMKLIDAYNSLFPENFIMENVIYCIHNEVNGKNYVGQTVKVKNRFSKTYVGHFRDYDRYISGELKETRALYHAWKKYGLESFSVFIIDTGIDREDLNQKEIYWIKTLHTCTKDPECFGYNLSWGADDMSVCCRESINKSLETRKRIYGDYFPNCHTQEAYDKGNRTKTEKYGHGGWVNVFTPEANEKRKQTNLERYGTTHGPNASKEAIDKMVKDKIEKFGDPMGICNTPENREKARKNQAKTKILNSIQHNLPESIKISCFSEYYKYISTTYKSITSVNYHIKQIFKYLPDLRTDDRWNTKLESIFQDLINMSEEDLNNMIKNTLDNRRKNTIEKIKGVHKSQGRAPITRMLKVINQNLSKFKSPNISWKEYCNLVLTNYVGLHDAYKHLDKLIDLLPSMKQDPRWTKEYESIFGSLTEKDKVKRKRNRRK